MALGKSLEFPFDRGDRVDHVKFGKGRVQQTLGSSGAEEKILVRFDSGEERILLAGFLTNVSRKDRAKPMSGRHAADVDEPAVPEPKAAVATEEEEEADCCVAVCGDGVGSSVRPRSIGLNTHYSNRCILPRRP